MIKVNFRGNPNPQEYLGVDIVFNKYKDLSLYVFKIGIKNLLYTKNKLNKITLDDPHYDEVFYLKKIVNKRIQEVSKLFKNKTNSLCPSCRRTIIYSAKICRACETESQVMEIYNEVVKDTNNIDKLFI